MNTLTLKLFGTGLFCFVLACLCLTYGTDYDKKYELYPQFEVVGCIIYPEYYGKRWEYAGNGSIFIGSSFILAGVLTQRKIKPILDEKMSIFEKEKK